MHNQRERQSGQPVNDRGRAADEDNAQPERGDPFAASADLGC